MSTMIRNIDELKEFCEIGEPIDCFIEISGGPNRDKSICRLEEDLFSVIDEYTGEEDTLTTIELISTENSKIGVAMDKNKFHTYANRYE